MADRDILAEETEAFERAFEAESEIRSAALDDVRFARLGEQWPDDILKDRRQDKRPALTVNRMPAFVRQVVNDSRLNRPQIKVKAADNKSDPKTAEIYTGLIRNIESVSRADIAYDTAVESAVYGGFGYIRLRVDYLYDESFDKGIFIDRISNPFTVCADPDANCADGSSWNRAFVTDALSEDEFEAQYKGAEKSSWKDDYSGMQHPWLDDEKRIVIAESWLREKVKTKLYKLNDGTILDETRLKNITSEIPLEALGLAIEGERDGKTHKVRQRIMTGAEVLETNDWAGKYIPVIPVYGEEFNVEGKRYFKSLIRDAKDAQRMFNYWRSISTELVALAPRVPYIGQEGAFDADPNWQTANSVSHPYLFHAVGTDMPQRQPLDSGGAAGAMQEAMTASEDMKSILNLYDASLGARSNETSGKAIAARQREGDVSTFHFIDNLSRSIRHVGCCLVDLIPAVYQHGQIIRIIGEDGKEAPITLGPSNTQDPAQQAAQDMPEIDPQAPPHIQKKMERQADLARVYDLSVGRYDVSVDSGPSFTTRREEIATQMTEIIRSVPQAAPVILPKMVLHLDIPGAEEMAEQLEKLNPGAENQLPPEVQQQMDEMNSALQQKTGELEDTGQKLQEKETNLKLAQIQIAEKDLEILRQKIVSEIQDVGQGLVDGQRDAADKQKVAEEKANAKAPVSVNIAENMGEQIALAIAPAVAQAVAATLPQMLQALPVLKAGSPRRIRTPVRDKNGLITQVIEEDEPEMVMQ